jgi:hypothetical protein
MGPDISMGQLERLFKARNLPMENSPHAPAPNQFDLQAAEYLSLLNALVPDFVRTGAQGLQTRLAAAPTELSRRAEVTSGDITQVRPVEII